MRRNLSESRDEASSIGSPLAETLLLLRKPAVSTIVAHSSPQCHSASTALRVVPAISDTSILSSPNNLLASVDLPLFGTPNSASEKQEEARGKGSLDAIGAPE